MEGRTTDTDEWSPHSAIEEDAEPYGNHEAQNKGEHRVARLTLAEELSAALAGSDLAAARTALAGLQSIGPHGRNIDVEAVAAGEGGAMAAARAAVAELEAREPLMPMAIPTDPDPPNWLVRDWLPAGRIAFLSGRGGAGKSRIALQLAAAVASKPDGPGTGIGFLDPAGHGGSDQVLVACGGPAVVATWEDDAQVIGWRLKHLLATCNWPGKSTIRERLHTIDLASYGPIWAPRADGSGHTSTLGALTPTGSKLRAYAEDLDACLLVLDPLAAASATNENDRGLVRQFMSSWDAWARANGCAVLLISHPAKATSGEGADYSGSTDWRNAARAVWLLDYRRAPDDSDKSGEEYPCLVLDKASYGPQEPVCWLAQDRTVWRQVEPPRPASSARGVAREVAP